MPETFQDISEFPRLARLSPLVHRVLGMNPSAFTGPGTNTYLVGAEGPQPVLIDTGSGVPGWIGLLREHLKEHGLAEPSLCLMTHGHPDHVGGLAHLQEAFPKIQCKKLPWPGRSLEPGVQALGEEAVITGPDYTLRAVFTPGHAPDHLCFLLEEERALFSGDVVLGVGTTVIPLEGGDLGLYLETLRTLLALDLAKIYPGHGPVIATPQEKLNYYLTHRLEREREILAQLKAGARSVEALVRVIYREYPEHLYAAAGQSVLSHLIKLERESAVTREVAEPPRFALSQPAGRAGDAQTHQKGV